MPLTILWVTLVVNAVNLVDGLDGLAAGMVAIAATAFFIYMVRTPSLFGDASAAALLSTITAGICVGFLPWNFHPARIFMGDSGAMLLGMLLTIATLSGVGRNPYPPERRRLAAIAGTVLVPLLVLAIPFLDVALAIVRRTWRGKGIGQADKEHIHHRLLDIGHSHRSGRAAHVPVERADLGKRARDRPDRRAAGRGGDRPVRDPALPGHGAAATGSMARKGGSAGRYLGPPRGPGRGHAIGRPRVEPPAPPARTRMMTVGLVRRAT